MQNEQWRNEFHDYATLLDAIAEGDRLKVAKVFGEYLRGTSPPAGPAGRAAPGAAGHTRRPSGLPPSGYGAGSGGYGGASAYGVGAGQGGAPRGILKKSVKWDDEEEEGNGQGIGDEFGGDEWGGDYGEGYGDDTYFEDENGQGYYYNEETGEWDPDEYGNVEWEEGTEEPYMSGGLNSAPSARPVSGGLQRRGTLGPGRAPSTRGPGAGGRPRSAQYGGEGYDTHPDQSYDQNYPAYDENYGMDDAGYYGGAEYYGENFDGDASGGYDGSNIGDGEYGDGGYDDGYGGEYDEANDENHPDESQFDDPSYVDNDGLGGDDEDAEEGDEEEEPPKPNYSMNFRDPFAGGGDPEEGDEAHLDEDGAEDDEGANDEHDDNGENHLHDLGGGEHDEGAAAEDDEGEEGQPQDNQNYVDGDYPDYDGAGYGDDGDYDEYYDEDAEADDNYYGARDGDVYKEKGDEKPSGFSSTFRKIFRPYEDMSFLDRPYAEADPDGAAEDDQGDEEGLDTRNNPAGDDEDDEEDEFLPPKLAPSSGAVNGPAKFNKDSTFDDVFTSNHQQFWSPDRLV